MRVLRVCLVVVLLVGCSAQIHSVPRSWDHASDPRCTTSLDYVAADGAIAALVFAGGFLTADRIEDRHTAGGVAIGAALVGGIFAIAAGAGASKVADCRRATEIWRIAAATAARERARERAADWFCAPDGSCARDRATCEQPGGSCVAVDAAWCFTTNEGERCYAAPDVCWPESRRAGDVATSGCQRR